MGSSVKTPTKDGQQTTFQRPLQLIHPLEISESLPPAEEVQDSNSKEATSPCNVAEQTLCHRQQRASAAWARCRMKDWSECLLEDEELTQPLLVSVVKGGRM